MIVVYATPDDLKPVAARYCVSPIPGDTEALGVLELASRDLDRFLLGVGTFDPLLLTPDQLAALNGATCVQACFRLEQGAELELGLQDNLASVGPLSFSLRDPRRLSPEAAEIVSGVGLYRRSGCAAPSPVPLPVLPPFP
jgi:hypothetical protein